MGRQNITPNTGTRVNRISRFPPRAAPSCAGRVYAGCCLCQPAHPRTADGGNLFPRLPQIIVQDLREMCFGSFEGRHYIHIEHDPDYLAWLEANKTAARPDGERIQDFCNRSCAAFAKLVEESLAQHKQQLVIVRTRIRWRLCPVTVCRGGIITTGAVPTRAATAWMPPTGKQTTPCSCWKPCSIPKPHKARQPYEQWFDSFIPR